MKRKNNWNPLKITSLKIAWCSLNQLRKNILLLSQLVFITEPITSFETSRFRALKRGPIFNMTLRVIWREIMLCSGDNTWCKTKSRKNVCACILIRIFKTVLLPLLLVNKLTAETNWQVMQISYSLARTFYIFLFNAFWSSRWSSTNLRDFVPLGGSRQRGNHLLALRVPWPINYSSFYPLGSVGWVLSGVCRPLGHSWVVHESKKKNR